MAVVDGGDKGDAADDKAETVSEFGEERLPIGGRKVSGEQAFGD